GTPISGRIISRRPMDTNSSFRAHLINLTLTLRSPAKPGLEGPSGLARLCNPRRGFILKEPFEAPPAVHLRVRSGEKAHFEDYLFAGEPGEGLNPQPAITVPVGEFLRQPMRPDIRGPRHRAALAVLRDREERLIPQSRAGREKQR